MADLTQFKQYMTLIDQLSDVASKDDLLECARLLAMNVAHYESTYGALPLDAVLDTLSADEPNDEQVKLLNGGMENLVGVLGMVIQGFEQKITH